jgi:hypothetical protein
MARLQITALEGQYEGEALKARLNPKEIVFEQAVPWQQQPKKGPADLAFERAEPAQMSFELLFDEGEAAASVQPQIDKLRRFSGVDTLLHRPPKVRVALGGGAGAMPAFDAVVESVSVRYLLFAENGVPVRATADVRLKQAAHLTVHKP